jgi:hypothetical protein
MTGESKVLQLILRLTRATVEKEIEWKTSAAPRSLTAGTDDIVPLYIETAYKGQRIALIERRYQRYDEERDSFYWVGDSSIAILDAEGRIVWESKENASSLDNLFQVARESAAKLDRILDLLLS